VITATPVIESNKSLEALKYKAALYCEISSLVFISHHSSSLNPSIICFAVVSYFNYFSQFSNCNISGMYDIGSVKPSSQLHPVEKSWIWPLQ